MNHIIPKRFKQVVRIGILFLVACASIAPPGTLSARQHRVKNQPVIRVGLYNYAGISRAELRAAEQQAAEVFAEARVQIAWLDYTYRGISVGSRSDDFNADFSVRILGAPGHMRVRRIPGAEVMGISIIPPQADGSMAGGIANVFYDRVRDVTGEWSPYLAQVLGEAIAHELGHLMLGPKHSRRGIMKLTWTNGDQQLIAHGELRFLRAQAGRIQRVARSLDQNPTLTMASLH